LLEQHSRFAFEESLKVCLPTVEATSRVDQLSILFVPWNKAITDLRVVEETVPIFVKLVVNDKNFIFRDGQLQIFDNRVVQIVAVNSFFSFLQLYKHFEDVAHVEVGSKR